MRGRICSSVGASSQHCRQPSNGVSRSPTNYSVEPWSQVRKGKIRMNEPSDISDTPARPQDYVGLRAELAELTNDFVPVINELRPRLEDHKCRWELHSYGLSEGYDRQVVADVIALLIEALKGIGIADNKLLQAHTEADSHNPSSPDTA